MKGYLTSLSFAKEPEPPLHNKATEAQSNQVQVRPYCNPRESESISKVQSHCRTAVGDDPRAILQAIDQSWNERMKVNIRLDG